MMPEWRLHDAFSARNKFARFQRSLLNLSVGEYACSKHASPNPPAVTDSRIPSIAD